jgi:GNAT superfamily N-acetyltransferase
LNASTYSAPEVLCDGLHIEIRSLRLEDQRALLSAVSHTGDQSLYRRFFSLRRDFTDQEVAHFLRVDFINQVALVVTAQDCGQEIIVGGGRYLVTRPREAELAFLVDDRYQGRGIGTLLFHHLMVLARVAGLKRLHAEVLADNLAMLRVFAKCAVSADTTRASGTVQVVVRLD